MEQQSKWMGSNQTHSMVKDFIYRTEYDHPNSLHNVTTGASKKMQVNFPHTSQMPDGTDASKKAQMSLNGFYDKEALSLKNGFKEHTNSRIQPMDKRLITT
mmetsp:Transcript_15333/g.23600  ORF Transcript_15333/g.23600 Transcript_15333/m.23600 type:complete len:101 (+) Transcript_15333:647-949(+)